MSDAPDRILITSLAASTCCGVGIDPLFACLRRGLTPGTLWPQTNQEGDHREFRFGPVAVDISDYVRITRTEHELTRQLFAAVSCDMGSQLAEMDAVERAGMGIIIGNTSGSYASYCQLYTTNLNGGFRRVNPTHLATALINYQAAQLSTALGMMGQSTTISSGHSAGLDAVGHAALRLRLGKERGILTGGIQELSSYDIEFLQSNRLVSATGTVRPFHEGRDGTVPAEAVALMLLERVGPGDAQGRNGLAEILGWATAMGGAADNLAAVAEQVTNEALRMARLDVEDVEAVFPSANGTVEGDEVEVNILRRLFGGRLGSIAVYPVKSIVGECLVASGPLQCIAAIYAMNHGKATADWAEGASSALRPAGTLARCANALVLSVGLDHTCSAVVLGKA